MVVIAELTLGLSVAGWFLSPNINRLMEVARSYASSHYEVKEKLQKLVQDMEDIKGSLHPDSLGEVNDQTRHEHVWRLKDAIHDAEETLALFELGKQSGLSGKFKGYKLVKVLENLRDMAWALRKDSGRNGGHSVLKRRETAQYPVRNRKLFFGYTEEYIQLVSMLQLDGNKLDTKVVAIIGHGGMGKTELALQAFHAVEGEFDLNIWVHAYDKNPFALLSEIWKSIDGYTQVGQMNLPCLQKELRKKLTSMRCLLVLDDVWNDEQDTGEVEMKQARAALDTFTGFVKDGSRIVVTTRAQICSRTLRADASIVLNGIKSEEITLLLNNTAGPRADGTAGDPRIHELLNRQVPKLKGSPLAAIEIGCKLKEQTTSYTGCDILDNIKHHISNVYKGHRFSYHHLPPHLQRCFAFCSIFPYNWRFEPNMLAKMWTAHRFVEEDIQPTGEKSHMEAVARGYFDSLVDRSLFQKEACTVEAGKQTCYVIHEHIHWMLRQDSAKNCIRVSRTTDPRSIPATVRHLSVPSGCLGKLMECPIRLSNVRTLLVMEEEDSDDDDYYDANDLFVDTNSAGDDDRAHLINTISKVILQFKDVRVLDLTGTGITELPASISKLTHVRYLGLPDSISTNLDDLDTRLPFLQTLIHNGKVNTETQKEVIGNTSGRGKTDILTDSGLARAEQRLRPTTSATVPAVLQSPKGSSATPQDVAPIGCCLTVAVLGWFVSPHITELMMVARDCAASSYMVYRGGKMKLGELVQHLDDIKCLLDPASMTLVNFQAKLDRLWRLKDDIHDIEEILDSFQVELRDDEATSSCNLIKKMKIRNNKVKLMRKLMKVLESVGETRNRAWELQHGASASFILARAETGPNTVRDQKSFFGYQEEYAQLVYMLWHQPDCSKVDGKMQQVIAIVGHAGMGKTELARRAFREAKGKFDRRIWVHAYGKNTEYALLKEIWKSVAGYRPVGEMNITCLQRELGKLLASKRCLLVLDDVWNHESAHNEVGRTQSVMALDLFTHFTEHGSRVVMTTRAKICSATFKADASIILDGIKDKEMTFLLNHTATDGTSENIDQRIQELIYKQVPKLKGSPLAAVEIGEGLKEKTTSREKCNIFDEIERHLGSVCQQHFFTYLHLPPHLQRCFEFCSIFPYNWRFEPDKLSKMWMALGFVEEMTLGYYGVGSIEDVAGGYFDDLVDRSLFQLEESRGGGDKQAHYVIHEQIHWMIRVASNKNCISISRHSTAPGSIPATVRHLSVASNCLDQLKTYPSCVLNKMRTLLVLKNDDGSTSSTFDKGILKLFKGVRVLDLTAETGLTHLPGTIHNLKHVRYLGLPSTMMNLCDEVTELLFLQTFSLDGKKQNTCRLQRFPKHMNRLVNMRHLDMDMECIANISGIGRMAKLQGPIEFKAVRASEKEGHAVSELEGMDSLRGTLSIKGLDTVASTEEAMKARLEKKSAVKVLKLEWGPPDAAAPPAPAVLEGLQPHPHLHELCITRYPGETWPNWLSGLEKLTRLYLQNCSKLKDMPDVGQLPSLELLDFKGLDSVERISSTGMFPKLNRIVLDSMPELVAWDNMPEQAFPKLTEVIIIDCPLLSSLSGLECCSCALEMRVKGCPAITVATLPTSFSTGVSTCTFQ